MRLWKIKEKNLSFRRIEKITWVFFLWYFCLVLVISLVKFSLFLDSAPIEDRINISPPVGHMEREPLATYNARKERPTKMTPQFRVVEKVQSLLNARDRFRVVAVYIDFFHSIHARYFGVCMFGISFRPFQDFLLVGTICCHLPRFIIHIWPSLWLVAWLIGTNFIGIFPSVIRSFWKCQEVSKWLVNGLFHLLVVVSILGLSPHLLEIS